MAGANQQPEGRSGSERRTSIEMRASEMKQSKMQEEPARKRSGQMNKTHVRFDEYLDLNEQNLRKSCKRLMNRLYAHQPLNNEEASANLNLKQINYAPRSEARAQSRCSANVQLLLEANETSSHWRNNKLSFGPTRQSGEKDGIATPNDNSLQNPQVTFNSGQLSAHHSHIELASQSNLNSSSSSNANGNLNQLNEKNERWDSSQKCSLNWHSNSHSHSNLNSNSNSNSNSNFNLSSNSRRAFWHQEKPSFKSYSQCEFERRELKQNRMQQVNKTTTNSKSCKSSDQLESRAEVASWLRRESELEKELGKESASRSKSARAEESTLTSDFGPKSQFRSMEPAVPAAHHAMECSLVASAAAPEREAGARDPIAAQDPVARSHELTRQRFFERLKERDRFLRLAHGGGGGGGAKKQSGQTERITIMRTGANNENADRNNNELELGLAAQCESEIAIKSQSKVAPQFAIKEQKEQKEALKLEIKGECESDPFGLEIKSKEIKTRDLVVSSFASREGGSISGAKFQQKEANELPASPSAPFLGLCVQSEFEIQVPLLAVAMQQAHDHSNDHGHSTLVVKQVPALDEKSRPPSSRLATSNSWMSASVVELRQQNESISSSELHFTKDKRTSRPLVRCALSCPHLAHYPSPEFVCSSGGQSPDRASPPTDKVQETAAPAPDPNGAAGSKSLISHALQTQFNDQNAIKIIRDHGRRKKNNNNDDDDDHMLWPRANQERQQRKSALSRFQGIVSHANEAPDSSPIGLEPLSGPTHEMNEKMGTRTESEQEQVLFSLNTNRDSCLVATNEYENSYAGSSSCCFSIGGAPKSQLRSGSQLSGRSLIESCHSVVSARRFADEPDRRSSCSSSGFGASSEGSARVGSATKPTHSLQLGPAVAMSSRMDASSHYQLPAARATNQQQMKIVENDNYEPLIHYNQAPTYANLQHFSSQPKSTGKMNQNVSKVSADDSCQYAMIYKNTNKKQQQQQGEEEEQLKLSKKESDKGSDLGSEQSLDSGGFSRLAPIKLIGASNSNGGARASANEEKRAANSEKKISRKESLLRKFGSIVSRAFMNSNSNPNLKLPNPSSRNKSALDDATGECEKNPDETGIRIEEETENENENTASSNTDSKKSLSRATRTLGDPEHNFDPQLGENVGLRGADLVLVSPSGLPERLLGRPRVARRPSGRACGNKKTRQGERAPAAAIRQEFSERDSLISRDSRRVTCAEMNLNRSANWAAYHSNWQANAFTARQTPNYRQTPTQRRPRDFQRKSGSPSTSKRTRFHSSKRRPVSCCDSEQQTQDSQSRSSSSSRSNSSSSLASSIESAGHARRRRAAAGGQVTKSERLQRHNSRSQAIGRLVSIEPRDGSQVVELRRHAHEPWPFALAGGRLRKTEGESAMKIIAHETQCCYLILNLNSEINQPHKHKQNPNETPFSNRSNVEI